MIYFIVFIFFLSACVGYLYADLNRLYYSNSSLIQFKELRHDVLLSLTDKLLFNKKDKNFITLNAIEEQELFLYQINLVITHFDMVKHKFTRYKYIKLMYDNIIYTAEEYKKINVTDESSLDLDEYKNRYHSAILTLFETIPFYKHRLIFDLIIVLLSLLVRLGVSKLNKTLNKTKNLYNIQKEFLNNDSQCLN